jgi:predicted permease
MGISLLAGRFFTWKDMEANSGTIVVNASFARRFFPNQNPVGKRIKLGFPEAPLPWRTVTGVVADVKLQSLEADSQPAVYSPYLQGGYMGAAYFVLHTKVGPVNVANAVRAQVRAVDPNQPVYDIQTMQARLDRASAPQLFKAWIFALFAVLALALATVGTYGVVAYSVSRRTHEIGVRMALGASRGTVLAMILRESGMRVAAGVAIGLLGAFGLSRFLESMLYRLSPTDPVTFFAVSLLLAATALLASYLPARRAATVDPVAALRHN